MLIFDCRTSVAVSLGGIVGGKVRFPVRDISRAMLQVPLVDFLIKLREHSPEGGEVEIHEERLTLEGRFVPYSYGAYFRTNFRPQREKEIARWAESWYSYFILIDMGEEQSILFLGDMQEGWRICHMRAIQDPEGYAKNPFVVRPVEP